MKEPKTSTVSNEAPKKRGKVNGYKSAKLHAKRDRKRAEAEARQREHDKLTTAQKLAKATGKREQLKLTAQLAREKESKKAPAPTPEEKVAKKAAKIVKYGKDLAKSNKAPKTTVGPDDEIHNVS